MASETGSTRTVMAALRGLRAHACAPRYRQISRRPSFERKFAGAIRRIRRARSATAGATATCRLLRIQATFLRTSQNRRARCAEDTDNLRYVA